MNAILYVARTGCQWRQLPGDFPPWGTVWWHFRRWRDDCTWEMAMRLAAAAVPTERRTRPRAVARHHRRPVYEVGPARAATGHRRRRRQAGQGPKRHLLCDALGLPLHIEVGSAQPHDSVGGWDLLRRSRLRLPLVGKVLADAGYQSLVARADHELRLQLEIRRKPADVEGFTPVPQCWKVEHSFAWLGRPPPRPPYAWCQVAALGMMLNRLHPTT